MATVRGHFRAMTRAEITTALNQSKYPFTYDIVNNPDNGLQIAINLTSKGKTIRVPNKKDWINIGG